MHKIAQNCVYNVQKLFAGGVAEKRHENGGYRHIGCWGDRRPCLSTHTFTKVSAACL